MSGQVRQAEEAFIEIYRALRDTREGGHSVYRLAPLLSLSGVHEVFHVSMLPKYTPDPAHVVDWEEFVVDTDATFEEGPVRITDSRDQVFRRKIVWLVKVLWKH